MDKHILYVPASDLLNRFWLIVVHLATVCSLADQ